MERILQDFINKPNLGFEFTTEERGGALVFTCRGAFSLGSYEGLNKLAAAVSKAKAKRTILDLREVAYIDSTGVGTIATILKDMRASGRELLVVPSAPVKNVLALVRIQDLIPSFETVEQALRS